MTTEIKNTTTDYKPHTGTDLHSSENKFADKKDEFMQKGAEAYAKTEEAVSQAYDKTSQTVNEGVTYAKNYTQQYPERTALIALGIGFGLGLLVAGSVDRRSSYRGRFAQPLLDAAYDVAYAFLR